MDHVLFWKSLFINHNYPRLRTWYLNPFPHATNVLISQRKYCFLFSEICLLALKNIVSDHIYRSKYHLWDDPKRQERQLRPLYPSWSLTHSTEHQAMLDKEQGKERLPPGDLHMPWAQGTHFMDSPPQREGETTFCPLVIYSPKYSVFISP